MLGVPVSALAFGEDGELYGATAYGALAACTLTPRPALFASPASCVVCTW